MALEKLVARYRREISNNAASAKKTIELEVRFHGVNFSIFETILKAFVSGDCVPRVVDAGMISNTVNSIMAEDPVMWHRTKSVDGDEADRANLVRLITFNTATGEKTGDDMFYRKWSITRPFRAKSALHYIVSLSAEEELDGPFTSDARAHIRVKSRASFKTHADAEGNYWRIDLTVVRTLNGSNAQAELPKTIQRMFNSGKAMTPANMLTLLGLADSNSEYRDLYNYELELEYVPRPRENDGAGGETNSTQGGDSIRPSEITALIGEILQLAKPEHLDEATYQTEVQRVAGVLMGGPSRRFEHGWGLKRLLPQATALTRGGYKDIYPPTGMFLLDKADGVRCIATVHDEWAYLLADKLVALRAPDDTLVADTIIDGELVRTDKVSFYAFDVIMLLGKNLTSFGYETRISHLKEAVDVLTKFGLDAHPKPIVHLTATEPDGLKAQFLSPVFQHRPYKTDGRILVEPDKPYGQTRAYKWKPLRDTTIDFLARRAPQAVLELHADAPGCELHVLFVGISSELFGALGLDRVPGYRDLFSAQGESYFPIQFAPSNAPLAYLYQHPVTSPGGAGWVREIDGKFVELRCVGDCAAAVLPGWELVQVREDRVREAKNKYYGNDFRVAELTWLNYMDPFDEAELWSGSDLGYFASAKSSLYVPQTAFTSFVKDKRIEATLTHAGWVVDTAIGKGQDFGRYVRIGVRNVVGIDKDQGALSELIRRKYSHAGVGPGAGKPRQGQRRGPTTLFVLQADLTAPHADIASRVRSLVGFPGVDDADGANALVINLAIHYLATDVVDLRNFAALCRSLVKVGGFVIITTMFGNRVHDKFVAQKIKTGESWDLRQDGVLKYSIRRDYAENSLTPAGQRIGVLLPFSDGKLYEECLVNLDTVTHEFSARGFQVVETPTFDTSFEEFRVRNPNKYRQLNPVDFQFLELYGEIILKREH